MFLLLLAQSPGNDWAGTWIRTGPLSKDVKPDRLVIWKSKVTRGAIHVHGNAYWYGVQAVEHTGGVEAEGIPEGSRVVLRQQTCELTLTLGAAEIEATDNSQCGGANVRFNGKYVRKSGH